MNARRRQAGQALLEWMIAAALMLWLVAWGADRWLHQAETVREEAVGRWLDTLGRALDDMLRAEFVALSDPQGVPQHPYRQRWAPTVDELKQFGYLPAAYPSHSAWGQTATIHLWRQGACPARPCQLHALAYLPPTPGTPEFSRRLRVLAQLDGYGGLVWPQHASLLRGGVFELPNPLPDGTRLPAGSVVVYRAVNAASLHEFVRVRDARDPDLQGELSVAGQARVGAGLSTAGRLDTGEFLRLGGLAVAGQACPQPGLVARELSGAELLLCANGSWQRAVSSHFGGMYFFNQRFGCRGATGESGVNPLTGQCNCPAGFKSWRISTLPANDDLASATQVYLCQR